MFKDEIRQSVRFKNIRLAAAARIAFSQRVREQAEKELKDLVHFHETPHREVSRRFGYRRASRYSQRAREYYESEMENNSEQAPDWYHESTIDVKLQELASALKNAVDYLVYDNVLGIDLEAFLDRVLVMKLTDDDYTLLEPILTTVYSVMEVAQDGDTDSAVAYAYEALELIADFLGEDLSHPTEVEPLLQPAAGDTVDIGEIVETDEMYETDEIEEEAFFEEEFPDDFSSEATVEFDEENWDDSFSEDEDLW